MSYYCYGNLLCHENDINAVTCDWQFCDTMILASSDKHLLLPIKIYQKGSVERKTHPELLN